MSAFVPAWLTATVFFLGLSLGALYVMAIGDLSGGRWSDALRPALTAVASALPVSALAMVVPLAGWRAVLPWTTLPAAALPEAAGGKLAYFDPAFLGLRTIACLAIWLALTWWMLRPLPPERRTQRAVVALILLTVTMLPFATDWMIAPDPQFYSTIYPILESSGEIAGAFALAYLVAWGMGSFRNDAEPEHGMLLSEDIANLLFGFILLWLYMSFMQWLIVWSGDLPDEIGWYLVRGRGAWPAVLVVMVALHLVLPTAALLSSSVKRAPRSVAIVAVAVLAGHLLDVIWRLAPSHGGGLVAAAFTIVSFVTVGAAWAAAARWFLQGGQWPLRWSAPHA
jgi:hypothetical protein